MDNKLLEGVYIPDLRVIDLEERLAMYYTQTPKEVSNKDAQAHYKQFISWCTDNGYTQEEINQAKRNVSYGEGL